MQEHPPGKGKYIVYIDDNFHAHEVDERLKEGEYDTAEEAIAVCKRIVDDWLESNFKPGMTAGELYESYTFFGEDPFIVAPEGDGKVLFSAWDYAKQRSEEIVSKNEN